VVRRKALLLVLAAAFAGATMGAESCEESVENLEDVSGENDSQYRDNVRRVKLGMTRQEVRAITGPPRSKQTMRSEFGRSDYWYYGTWQITFDHGKVDSKNRY
jgi:outer membrane protein assembly factor BamE (lipoprotein component of BamABCDE complex)